MQRCPELYEILLRHGKPSDAFWEALCLQLRTRNYEKGEVWIRPGVVPYRIGMIQGGAALAYMDVEETRQLVRIWKECQLILLAQYGVFNRPSEIEITFPLDSTVVELSYPDLLTLLMEYPEARDYKIKLLGEEVGYLSAYATWLKCRPVKLRIKDFREQYSLLDNLLSDEVKALYLGMSRRWYQEIKMKSE